MTILEKLELGEKIANKLHFVAEDYLKMLYSFKPEETDEKYQKWVEEVNHWSEVKKDCEDWLSAE